MHMVTMSSVVENELIPLNRNAHRKCLDTGLISVIDLAYPYNFTSIS